MPNIIDSLFIEIGLDPAKFVKGRKETEAQFKGLRDDALKTGNQIEEQAARSANIIGDIQRRALGLFGMFVGAAGIKDFVVGVTQSEVALGRLSRNIGVSTRDIQSWQIAARLVGGDAKAMAGSFKSMSDVLAGWKIGIFSPMVTDMIAAAASVGKTIDISKGPEAAFLQLADIFKELHAKSPETAGVFQSRLGLDPALFDLMLKGGPQIVSILREMRAFTGSEKDIEAGERLQASWARGAAAAEKLGQSVLTTLTPALEALNSVMEKGSSNFSKMFGEGSQFDAESKGLLRGIVGAVIGPDAVKQIWGGGGSAGATPAILSPGLGARGGGAFSSLIEKEAFIRAEAARLNIDPNVAVAVAKKEGFYKFSGDQGTSFGAFQLHYKNNIPGLSNPGLGDAFTRATGLDARNPANERAGISFALEQAARGGQGWGPWHGWKGAQFAGIGAQAAAGTVSNSSNSSEVNVNGPITVQTQATDANGIARDLRGALTAQADRMRLSAQSNSGQN